MAGHFGKSDFPTQKSQKAFENIKIGISWEVRKNKSFHVKLFRKAWGKMKYHLKIIMWKIFSTKTDFTEFLLVKTQVFGQIWEL